MDWEFLIRYGGQYTVLFGGGTVAVAYLLPAPISPYALLAAVAVGMLLIGKAVIASGGGGPMTGGSPLGSEHAMAVTGDNDLFAAREPDEPAGAGEVFYALGLVAFGLFALWTLP